MNARWFLLWVASIPLLTGCWKGEGSAAKPTPPAKVERLPVETELARVTLTPEAEKRLGVALVKLVKKKDVARRRVFGGELLAPPGKTIVVAAPIPGTITPPLDGVMPTPGAQLGAGEPVLTIVPLLSPERDVPTPAERVQMANARATLLAARNVAAGDVEHGKAEVKGAQVMLVRAKQLLSDMAGTAQAVDDAEARVNIAKADLQGAEVRLKELTRLASLLDSTGKNGQPSPLPLASPQSGILRTLSVSRQQTVVASAPLFEVVDTSTLWVRVPVYVDDLSELNTQGRATLVRLGARESASRMGTPRLLPVKISPPAADPLNSTVDIFYELANQGAALRPGQRVGVEIELAGQQEALVVPAAAVLYDVHGGTWIYVKTGDHAFERRRIEVQFTQGSEAVLSAGPPEGSEVVTAGAAEIFGTEFGAGK